jgi:Fe2+ or Zn2+ uptake regulation protein
MNSWDNPDDMGKEDRKEMVLKLLAESGFALPPAAIFRNAKLQGATFERRSVNNYLEELAEEGLVKKIDANALNEGEIKEVDPGKSGYFIATEEGKSKIE